jgi:hypothetical protein
MLKISRKNAILKKGARLKYKPKPGSSYCFIRYIHFARAQLRINYSVIVTLISSLIVIPPGNSNSLSLIVPPIL